MTISSERCPRATKPHTTNQLFAPIFSGALKGRKANWMGRLDLPHDLVFIDDAAAACVLLGETDGAYGQAWHIPGAGPVTGREFLTQVFAAAGRSPRVGVLPAWLVRLAGLFDKGAREMVELMYEFEEPLVLDGGKFAGAFPGFRYTTHAEAVGQTLDWFSRNWGS